jgi:hypothetical protein
LWLALFIRNVAKHIKNYTQIFLCEKGVGNIYNLRGCKNVLGAVPNASGGCKQFLGECAHGVIKGGTTELFSKISKPIPNFLKFAENHFFHQNNGI